MCGHGEPNPKRRKARSEKSTRIYLYAHVSRVEKDLNANFIYILFRTDTRKPIGARAQVPQMD